MTANPSLDSRRNRIKLLLGAYLAVLPALRAPDQDRVSHSKAGSLALVNDDPWWRAGDFEALQRALDELRSIDGGMYAAVWAVFVRPSVRPSVTTPSQRAAAVRGILHLEQSRHLPAYVRIPSELLVTVRRPRTHVLKRKQNELIAEWAAAGETHEQIAVRLGISRPRVTNILRELRDAA